MEVLPVIDLSSPAAASEIDRACRDTGFFLVSGHGVPAADLDVLDRAARAFFACPADEKAEIAMARGGRAWRGWFPEGGELTSGRPDRKEGIYFGADLPTDDPRVAAGLLLHGPNLYPRHPVGLRTAVDRWMADMTSVGHRLLELIAEGLGLEPQWFRQRITADPTVLFRIFRYPVGTGEVDADPDADAWGVGEHTDYGLVTILAHDGTPGLQVRSRAGWLDVPARPDTFVINLGDMLDRMTQGRYRSTPHRVRRTVGPRDRLSFPFFFDPGWDTEIGPVPLLDGELPPDDADTRWDGASVHAWEGTYGDYLSAKVAHVFPDLAP